MKVFDSEKGSLAPGHQQQQNAVIHGLNKEKDFCFDCYIITNTVEFCQSDSHQQWRLISHCDNLSVSSQDLLDYKASVWLLWPTIVANINSLSHLGDLITIFKM